GALAALCAGALLGCEAAEKPGEPAAEALPQAALEDATQKSQQAASVATGAAESAAEAAQQAGNAAEAAEELSGEAASLLTALGFVDDRDVVQVLNIKLGTRVTFVPATIVVTAGTGRKLSIFNDTDAPHGFRIPGLALEVLLPPGEETVVELPPLVGPQIYGIECHLHVPHRHASLVVLPARPSGD
ncbi:MAG: cupredoxin domain-containing protein, partial [Candidatus Limnocylindria bacterium]